MTEGLILLGMSSLGAGQAVKSGLRDKLGNGWDVGCSGDGRDSTTDALLGRVKVEGGG